MLNRRTKNDSSGASFVLKILSILMLNLMPRIDLVGIFGWQTIVIRVCNGYTSLPMNPYVLFLFSTTDVTDTNSLDNFTTNIIHVDEYIIITEYNLIFNTGNVPCCLKGMLLRAGDASDKVLWKSKPYKFFCYRHILTCYWFLFLLSLFVKSIAFFGMTIGFVNS